MVGADAHVLVEVERGELRPVDPGRLAQLREELVLRGSRGEDHGGPAVAAQEPPDLVGRRRAAAAAPSTGRFGWTSTRMRPTPRTRAPACARRRRPLAQLVARPSRGSAAARPPAPRSRGASASPTRTRPSGRSSRAAASRARAPPGSRRARAAPAATGRGRRHGACASFRWTWRTKRAERGEARLGLLAELGVGVGRVPDDADPVAPRFLDEGARGGRGREVAVRLEPDLDAAAPQPVAQRRERLDDPVRASRRDPRPAARGRRRHGCPRAPSSAATSAVRTASSTAVRRARGVGAVEERARVDAGDREAGVRQPRPRLAQARARRARAAPRARRRSRGSAARRRRSPAGRPRRGSAPGATRDSRGSRRQSRIRSSAPASRA